MREPRWAADCRHHTSGVQRAVKPDNIMLGRPGKSRSGTCDSTGTVRDHDKVAGFGLARMRAEHSQTASIAGAPAYMAPEVLRGRPADPASDQFSFGVAAYEVMAGCRPFAGTPWSEPLRTIEAGNVRPPAPLPGWLRAASRPSAPAVPDSNPAASAPPGTAPGSYPTRSAPKTP